MKRKYLTNLFKKANRRLLIFSFILFFLSLLTFIFSQKKVYNTLKPPYFIIGIILLTFITSMISFAFFLLRHKKTIHPTYKIINKYGNLENIINDIDENTENEVVEFSKLKITKNWILYEGLFTIKLMKLHDIIWIYKHHVEHRVNFEKSGDSYSVIIHDKYGDSMGLSKDSAIVEKAMRYITSKVPWAINGYSKELERTFQYDRRSFLTIVEHNKNTYIKMQKTHEFNRIDEKESALNNIDNYKHKLFLERGDNGLYGYRNENGELVIPFSFENANKFNEGLALVYKQELLFDKYTFINTNGELIIDYIFDYAEDFSEGLALVRKNDQFGYINKMGKFLIYPKYDAANSFKNGVAKVQKGILDFIINKKGEII